MTPLGAAQREAAARVLARAFRDNPLNRAVVGRGEARRMRSTLYGMRASLAAGRRIAQVLSIGVDSPQDRDAVRGILLAVPPGSFPLHPMSLIAQLRSVLGQGWRISRRWGDVYRALEAVHPSEPHWYLSLLGIDPDHQGRGLGGLLLGRWLESVDRDRQPGYLETDREENLRFYSRVGFSVETELRVLGTPVWCMRRPAA